MARDRIIGVRVDGVQSDQFERAAKNVGKKVSDWLRELGAAAIAPPQPSVMEINRTVADSNLESYAVNVEVGDGEVMPQVAAANTLIALEEIVAKLPKGNKATMPTGLSNSDAVRWMRANRA